MRWDGCNNFFFVLCKNVVNYFPAQNHERLANPSTILSSTEFKQSSLVLFRSSLYQTSRIRRGNRKKETEHGVRHSM